MGVIDNYRKILAAANRFQPSGDAAERFDSFADVLQADAQAKGCSDGSHYVVDVRTTHEASLDVQLAISGRKMKGSAVHPQSGIENADIGIRGEPITHSGDRHFRHKALPICVVCVDHREPDAVGALFGEQDALGLVI
jgi:hypothetical protein